MKSITVRELQRKIRECVRLSQKESVVVTRHGRPAAIVIGVEGQDWEDLVLRRSPAFWKMIERRRKEKTVPLQEMRRRLGVANGRRRKKA
jgi:prevent-host-death family protein